MRLLEAAAVSSEEWPTGLRAAKDTALWHFYRPFTGLEALQRVLGAFTAQERLQRCGTLTGRSRGLETLQRALGACVHRPRKADECAALVSAPVPARA